MNQNQRRSGLKHVKTIRNILDGTAIESEASAQIERHLEGIKALFESDERMKLAKLTTMSEETAVSYSELKPLEVIEDPEVRAEALKERDRINRSMGNIPSIET